MFLISNFFFSLKIHDESYEEKKKSTEQENDFIINPNWVSDDEFLVSEVNFY